MGAYLGITVYTKICVSEKDIHQNGRTTDTFLKQVQAQGSIDTKIFDFVPEAEDEGYWEFRLKSAAIQTDFVPFLTAFFNDFYGINTMQETLEQVTACQSFEDLETLAEDSYVPFQKYYDHSRRYLYTSKSKYITATATGILLSMEGKISFEALENHLEFFDLMMHKAYASFSFGKLLEVRVV